MLWGIIIAVATWHPYRWLSERLGGRRKLGGRSSSSLALLLILVVPISLLVNSLAEGVARRGRPAARPHHRCSCRSRRPGCGTCR